MPVVPLKEGVRTVLDTASTRDSCLDDVARGVIDRTFVTSWVARGRLAAGRHGLTVAAEIEIPGGRFLSDLSFNLTPNREKHP